MVNVIEFKCFCYGRNIICTLRVPCSLLDACVSDDTDRRQNRDHDNDNQKLDNSEAASQSRASNPPKCLRLHLACRPDTVARGSELPSVLRFSFCVCHKLLMTMTRGGNRVNKRSSVIFTTNRQDYCTPQHPHV